VDEISAVVYSVASVIDDWATSRTRTDLPPKSRDERWSSFLFAKQKPEPSDNKTTQPSTQTPR